MLRYDSVDAYLEGHPQWRPQLDLLRSLLRATQLEETIKWGAPCYCLGSYNAVGLVAFKNWVSLWFHQGVLLPDPAGVLINAQQGKTRAQRQWRFTAGDRIDAELVQRYLEQAVALAQRGEQVLPAPRSAAALPRELSQALQAEPKLREAFAGLTPGRQRQYAEHIGSAKQAATRQRRLDRALPDILAGRGLNDRYR